MSGKGDTYRPVDWDKWSKNYDRIFGCQGQHRFTATEAQETAGKLDESGGENDKNEGINPTTGGGTS